MVTVHEYLQLCSTYDVPLLLAKRSISMGVSFATSKPPKTWVYKPSLGPSTALAPSPLYQHITVLIILTTWHYVVVNSFLYLYLYMSGPSNNPSPICSHHRHHQHVKRDAIAPSPSKNHGNIHPSNWICLLESLCCSHAHLYYKKKILRYLQWNRAIPLFIVLHNFTREKTYLI